MEQVFPDERISQSELMDQPELDRREHHHALSSLGRMHTVCRSVARLWPPIRRVAARISGRPIRLLDLACGGGHLAVGLAGRCARAGVAADIVGADVSPVAIDYAKALAARSHSSGVSFVRMDAMNGPLPELFDVVICSLFLHHLSEEQAVALLRRMKSAARHLVLVSDLRRTSLGYAVAWAGTRFLSRSHVFHSDGPASVRAAFTTSEARAMAERAGLSGARVTECWPERYLIEWTPDGRS